MNVAESLPHNTVRWLLEYERLNKNTDLVLVADTAVCKECDVNWDILLILFVLVSLFCFMLVDSW
jgi:hypothetical protein